MGIISTYINRFFPKWGMKHINVPSAKKRWKGKLEEHIVNGQALDSRMGQQGVLFFSVHKSGSSISLRYLKRLARRNDLKRLNYEAYLSSVAPNKKGLLLAPDFLKRAFNPVGYFYGCLRTFVNVPELDKYKIVLLLRDPRDVLVSYYFSMKHTNTIHQNKGVEARKRVNEITIDEYVLEIVPRFKLVYETYIEKLLPLENVYFTKFEDLIEDSPKWLQGVADYCDLEVENDLLDEIKKNVNNEPRKENPRSHHRKSTHGDFKVKLKEETVEKLNEAFDEILKKLDYTL